MRPELYSTSSSPASVVFFALISLIHSLASIPTARCSVVDDLKSNYFDPPPSPEDGPPLSAGALRDTTFLPAQIGGIVGSYALALIIVAAVLLALAKKRREHLTAAEDELDPFAFPFYPPVVDDPVSGITEDRVYTEFDYPRSPRSPIKNFSYPTPGDFAVLDEEEKGLGPYVHPPPQSSSTLGVNPLVDQRVVAADREMAQQQLEEMYKHVMEQEAAKEAGIAPPEGPPPAITKQASASTTTLPKPGSGFLKKGKNKPGNLDLERGEPEKSQSRTSSLFSALRSPRKSKSSKALNISSPIMTPMSGTFPRQEEQEMNTIPPRHYHPAAPPPVPSLQQPLPRDSRQTAAPIAPITPPDLSPESTQSIDERLGNQLSHSRAASQEQYDPSSAVSERSTTPLVGLPASPRVSRMPSLPASPRPGATFPASPKPGSSFSRPNAPSAVRTDGALPLRAYQQPLASPSTQTTKQTTFERAAPLSPSGLRTPWTGAPTPYTPYQPFSPVIPVTPSLVTKADRKRMKQLQPKTPTVEMVKSSDELW